MFKKLMQAYLRGLAKMWLARYTPDIVAVTGNIGKTSTREAVTTVLRSKFRVRQNEKNFNAEFGVPLTILGLRPAHGLVGWLAVAVKALGRVIVSTNVPDVLVLEMAADHPGDIGYLVSFAKPTHGIFTAMGELPPVHREFFRDEAQLVREKAKLLSAVPKNGVSVMNFDDKKVMGVRERVKSRVLTFGMMPDADILGSDVRLVIDGDDGAVRGTNFKVHYKGSVTPFLLPDVFSNAQVYAALTATAIGVTYGMNVVEISNALRTYASPAGRMRLLPGIKHTLIVDDTYNAAPSAMKAALETLRQISSGRLVVVLGDMLELGPATEEAHTAIGKVVAKIESGLVFTVGAASRFIAAEAEKGGVPKDHIFSFDFADECKLEVQKRIEEGDVILVKGSQSMRMEKVVKEIMANPERAGELLVRQSKEWSMR